MLTRNSFLYATLSVTVLAGVGRAAPLREAVIEAAQERHAAARSFHIEWEGTRRVLLLHDIDEPAGKLTMDETIKFTSSLSVDGTGQVRFRTSDKRWSTATHEFIDFSEDTAFNKAGRTTFQDADFPAVIKGDPDPTHPLNYVRYVPITTAYRTFDKGCGVLNLASFTAGNAPDGQQHIVGTSRPTNSRTIKVWFDASRDYLPIRYAKIDDGIPTQQVSLQYKTTDTTAPELHAWDVVTKNISGATTEVIRATVTSIDLGATFDSSHFTVEVPDGVLVEDFERQEKYVLQDDGTKIDIDRGVTLSDIRSLIDTGRYAEDYDWRWLSVVCVSLGLN